MHIADADANEAWCPFSRMDASAGVYNRLDSGLAPHNCRCLGSACMAWRWQPLLADDAYADAVRKAAEEIGDKTDSRAKAAKHVNANRAQYGLPTQPFRGYCGLAGKPEVA